MTYVLGPENNLSCGGGSTVSIPVSVVEVSCSPPVTAESVAATDTAHTVTPSSGSVLVSVNTRLLGVELTKKTGGSLIMHLIKLFYLIAIY